MFTRLLVPIDGSGLSERAIPSALKLADQFGGEVTLIRVFQPDPHFTSGVGRAYDTDVMRDIYDMRRAEARTYVEQKVEALRKQGHNVKAYFVEAASAAETIIDVVDELDIDTVVMSTHGRGGLGRWMYGSVAEKILRHAHAPVLLIRAGVEEETNGL